MKESIASSLQQDEKEESLMNFFVRVGHFKKMPKVSEQSEEAILGMTIGKKFAASFNSSDSEEKADVMSPEQKDKY